MHREQWENSNGGEMKVEDLEDLMQEREEQGRETLVCEENKG